MTTEPTPAPAPVPAPAPTVTAQNEPRPDESVLIRPWPKVVFFYPTFLTACVAFLLSWLLNADAQVLGNTFMAIFCANLMVFSFDFSRIKSITIAIGAIAVVLLILWLNSIWKIMPAIGTLLESFDIRMNAQFYGWLATFMGFLFLLVWVNSRFHYYEVNAREILHHHGYLGDITRWSTEGLEMNKEIYDMAEYLLLRSGRLIFLPQSAKKAIVLDNVAKVNQIEERVNDLLSVVAVRFNQRPGPG